MPINIPLNVWLDVVAETAVNKPLDGLATRTAEEFDHTDVIVKDKAGKHYRAKIYEPLWLDNALPAHQLKVSKRSICLISISTSSTRS